MKFVALERSAFAEIMADTGADMKEAEDSVVGTSILGRPRAGEVGPIPVGK